MDDPVGPMPVSEDLPQADEAWYFSHRSRSEDPSVDSEEAERICRRIDMTPELEEDLDQDDQPARKVMRVVEPGEPISLLPNDSLAARVPTSTGNMQAIPETDEEKDSTIDDAMDGVDKGHVTNDDDEDFTEEDITEDADWNVCGGEPVDAS